MHLIYFSVPPPPASPRQGLANTELTQNLLFNLGNINSKRLTQNLLFSLGNANSKMTSHFYKEVLQAGRYKAEDK